MLEVWASPLPFSGIYWFGLMRQFCNRRSGSILVDRGKHQRDLGGLTRAVPTGLLPHRGVSVSEIAILRRSYLNVNTH